MNYIFLDIDGVLVPENNLTRSNIYDGYEFNVFCVELLKEIIEKTNSKIVISSSWRESRTLDELQGIFSHYGIENCIVGVTPILGFMSSRGEEIKRFMDEENLMDINFVIIDDLEEMVDLESHTVRTSSELGLRKENVYEIVSKFV